MKSVSLQRPRAHMKCQLYALKANTLQEDCMQYKLKQIYVGWEVDEIWKQISVSPHISDWCEEPLWFRSISSTGYV